MAESPKQTAYNQTVHTPEWIARREAERAEADPWAIIADMQKRLAVLEAWVASFRIAGNHVSGSGPQWAIADPRITLTGTGEVACDEGTGTAAITLNLEAKLE